MNVLILGASADARDDAASRHLRAASRVVTLETASLPFVSASHVPAGATLFLPDIDRAFPNHQTGGARLVLTQSAYVVQRCLEALGPAGSIVAAADSGALEGSAPEALNARGPWRHFKIEDLGAALRGDRARQGGRAGQHARQPHAARDTSVRPATALLVRAYASASAAERVALSRQAAELEPGSPIPHLALASALREVDDRRGARAELDRTIELAPDWEAAHFENGKFWLGSDDMERARDAFRRAGELMPAFSAAFSNLGATLGELDEPEAALAAFQQALAHDPHGFQIVNNIGVVTRELGRLDDSEAAFRRVIELAPEFVFGYYNLGHTLFLAGKYSEALAAYEEGQRRDPQKNRRQGCRLAMMRLANGDAAGAERDLWRFADGAPAAEREDLLLEAYEIGMALVSLRPELAVARPLLDRIGAEIGQ